MEGADLFLRQALFDFLLIHIAGITAFPMFFDELIHCLEEQWSKLRKPLVFACSALVLVAFSYSANGALERTHLLPGIERQIVNKVNLEGELYPILTACDVHTRLLHGWEMRERIIFTFCSLHKKLPAVLRRHLGAFG